MNVLSDFIGRVKAQYPDTVDNEELSSLLTIIRNQEKKIKKLEAELKSIREANVEKFVKKKEEVE